MRKIHAIISAIVITVVVLVAALLVAYHPPGGSGSSDVHVGVTYCGDSVEEGKQLIDKVKGYTNLFVLQSGTLQRDFESVDELGDYAVAAGMFFLPYFGVYIRESFAPWLESAQQRWGSHLLGVYYADEPAGKMLDGPVEFEKTATGDSIEKTKYGDLAVTKPDGVVIHYEIGGLIHLFQPENPSTGAASIYATFYPDGTITPSDQVADLIGSPTYESLMAQRPLKDVDEAAQAFLNRDHDNIEFLHNSTRVFTSDYALPWFDYLSGYDVVLCQLGWNLTLSQQIAQVRGAARLQNKDWGVVITWKYDAPPYLDTGTEILGEMRSAYECGAKYIVLFNYYDGAGSTLKDEHFQALQSFWNGVVKNPNIARGSMKADNALVLPENYGWGMRWKDDKIWGIFNPDEKAPQIWHVLQSALETHGLRLDIVYEDSDFPLPTEYQNIVQWNQNE